MGPLFLSVGILFLLFYVCKYALFKLRLEDMQSARGCVRFEFTVSEPSTDSVVLVIASQYSFQIEGAYLIPVGPLHRTYVDLRFFGGEEVSCDLYEGMPVQYIATFECGPLPRGTYILGVVTDSWQNKCYLTQEVL